MADSEGQTYIHALESRFTCKRYDPEGHISDSAFNTILEAGRLAPSSFGFEPWKFLVIEDRRLWQIFSSVPGAPRRTPTAPCSSWPAAA